MAKSNVLSFTVPDELKLKLDTIAKIGYYDSLSEFLRDAIRNLLEKNEDLRIAIAYELVKEKKISMGKAVEIAKISLKELKDLFQERKL